GEVKGAAPPRRALDPDAPAHALDQPRRDGQAQPGAAVAPCRRAIHLSERLENKALLVRRDTNTCVAHLEMQDASRLLGTLGLDLVGVNVHDDLAALGELDG